LSSLIEHLSKTGDLGQQLNAVRDAATTHGKRIEGTNDQIMDPHLMQQYAAFNASRSAFHASSAAQPVATPADQWQKHYFKGQDMAGTCPVSNHQTKLRLKDFASLSTRRSCVPTSCSQPRYAACGRLSW